MSQQFENFRLEHQALADVMKACFDAYYKLANMTFAWNASLGAAVAFLVKDDWSSINKTLALSLSLFAAFYNFAALMSYIATVRCFRRTQRQTHDLLETQEGFEISKEMLEPRTGIKSVLVECFIALVLVFMTTIWLSIFFWGLCFDGEVTPG